MLVTRRFTPPTCTLEIEANSSTLSHWTKQQAIQEVQFQLSFDDPRLTESEQVTIKGDRTQLEQLHQAISSYVHNFLQQSSLEDTVASSPSTPTDPAHPYLQAQGLLTHKLWLGSLENNTSGDKIELDTIQLFDLVTALEDYEVEIAAIPNLNAEQNRKVALLPTIVASIIAIIGLGALGFNIFRRSSTQFQSATSVPDVDPKPQQQELLQDKQDEVIPPQITKAPDKPIVQSTAEKPLSSKSTLPPPPPVDAPKSPPANVPDFSKYPLPKPNRVTDIKPKLAKKPKSNRPVSRPPESRLALRTEQKNIPIPDVDVPPLPTSLLPTETDIINNSVAKTNTSNFLKQPWQGLEAENSSSNPQLKEIKQYFQQQWQPPAELKQTIEYRLVVSSQGSIVRITPIGKASAIFIDRTNIPLMGETFISPSQTKGNQTVRLLLSPDGDVKTFLESK